MAFLLLPFLRKPIVAVDLLLNKARGAAPTTQRFIKRFVFGRIDHFIHYFRDLSGYQKYFGIGPDRSSFVWFKPNIREHPDVQARLGR